uniref:SpoIID/LytB domain-containing protein n=1 Tax=Hominenteromicrobium sp. TaxID=3073581 RepID=UPI003AF069BD
DFLCGALPCEMAVSAPDEALKAQIIAIHTLYDRKRRENTGKDFDFSFILHLEMKKLIVTHAIFCAKFIFCRINQDKNERY